MNNKEISKDVINKLTDILKFTEDDIVSILTYFEDFNELNDDEIISVFDDNHPNYSKYSDMIELVYKENPKEMYCWINDEKYAAVDLADFIIPENCEGKTLAEAYVHSLDNVLVLSDDTCVFKYV